MKRKTLITITLLFCGIAVGLAAIIAGIDGKWSSVLTAPDGNQYPLTYTFKVDSARLTGTVDTPQGTVPIDSGKVMGDSISFSVTVQGNPYPHTGKYYANADSIGMDVDFGGAKGHETLKRVP